MTIIEIITPILGASTTGIVAYFTYRAGRRKSNAEARKAELQNVEDAIKIWRDTAEAMASKAQAIAEKSSEDYHTLYNQNLELLKINKELVVKITKLEKELEQLKKTA